jgi:Flp pilus assembly protein TadG
MKRSGIIGSIRRFGRARRGTASVEFVMVLPIILVLLYGTIDIGRLLVDYHVVSKSIRDATRYLTRKDGALFTFDCTNGNVTSTATPNPLTQAMMLSMTGSIDGSTAFLLPYWNNTTSLAAAGITVSVDCFDNTGNTYQGYYTGYPEVYSLTVSADVSFSFLNGWILGRNGDLTFTISHKEVHFGQ